MLSKVTGFLYISQNRKEEKRMIKTKITNQNGKTFVAEFPCDVRNFYNGMSSIGVTELMRQINVTDAEDSPVKVKLYADNDIGNHLILLFTEKNNLDDVHLATYLLTSVNKQVQSELEQQIINDQYDSLEKLYQDICHMAIIQNSFYFPLTGSLYDREYDDSDTVDNMLLTKHEKDIRKAFQSYLENDNYNMAEYYDSAGKEKLLSADWDVVELSLIHI